MPGQSLRVTVLNPRYSSSVLGRLGWLVLIAWWLEGKENVMDEVDAVAVAYVCGIVIYATSNCCSAPKGVLWRCCDIFLLQSIWSSIVASPLTSPVALCYNVPSYCTVLYISRYTKTLFSLFSLIVTIDYLIMHEAHTMYIYRPRRT